MNKEAILEGLSIVPIGGIHQRLCLYGKGQLAYRLGIRHRDCTAERVAETPVASRSLGGCLGELEGIMTGF